MTNKEIFNLYEGLYELSQDKDLKIWSKNQLYICKE